MLEIGGGPIFRTQVFSGSLHLEGERFLYARGEENTQLGDTLNRDEVSAEDFSLDSLQPIAKQTKCAWYCSLGEDHLNIFYVPDLDKDFSYKSKIVYHSFSGHRVS